MKTLSFLIVFVLAQHVVIGQRPILPSDAMAQLYHDYNVKEMTAQLLCPTKQSGARVEGWHCSKGYSTIDVSQVLMAEVREGGTAKTYLVASAVPTNLPEGYECHACVPAIGVAVFAWESDRWALQSANPEVGYYGGWGGPPQCDLMTIGPEKHGVLLSINDEGQGYASSKTVLLAPVGNVVAKVWSIEDEQDDFGAFDPAGVDGPKVKYRSTAALKFVVPEDYEGVRVEYYDIEVISRGLDQQDAASRLKDENWTEIYRFSDGKYRLLRHTDFTEVPKRTGRATKKH